MDTTTIKDKLARFGRAVTLLFNRCMMYQKSHPMVQESIADVHNTAALLFPTISPLVFILNRDQFFVDEEQIDPRINVKRIAMLFKKHKIQSVSFENGLTPSELDIFVELFSTMTLATDAEELKKTLFKRGVFNLKINHVLYKKVTQDDEIISREALRDVTPSMEAEDGLSRKKFMDTLLESILTEEFANTINVKTLLADPGLVSRNMIKADLVSVQKRHQHQSSGGGAAKEMGSETGAGDGHESRHIENGESKGIGMGTGDASASSVSGPGGGRPAQDSETGRMQGPAYGPRSGAMPSDVDDTIVEWADEDAGTGQGPGMGYGPHNGWGTPGGNGNGAGTGGGLYGISATIAGSEAAMGANPAVTKAGWPDRSIETVGGAVSDPSGQTPGAGGVGKNGAAGHGPMLLHQLELMQQEVRKQLDGGGDVSLQDLADAVFEMKKQFFEELKTQKALGIAYANEAAIVNNMNQLTDAVIVKLIQEEYSEEKITTHRLAQIILRLIPDPQELRRLIPQIKRALISAGMANETYLELIDSLKQELQNEELARILEESAHAIGVDSDVLIDELKRNPDQAAKLIYLASEVKKGTGDESVLADLLVEYVEKMTAQAAESQGKDEKHLKNVVGKVESALLHQLSKLDVDNEVLARMENRINERMDSILDKMRVEWLNAQTSISRKEKHLQLSVLQTLEHNVQEDEALMEILKTVRAKVEAGEIEENNFSQINAEIFRQRDQAKKKAESIEMPEGVLNAEELMFILEKEIARTNRYNAPFSALAFSFVSAKPRMKALDKMVTTETVMAAALDKLAGTLREVDYIGQTGKNKMVALLPMNGYASAKKALTRMMNVLNSHPLSVHGVPVDLRVAGVVSEFNSEQTADAQAFAKRLTNQLMDMVARVKNIQVLF